MVFEIAVIMLLRSLFSIIETVGILGSVSISALRNDSHGHLRLFKKATLSSPSLRFE